MFTNYDPRSDKRGFDLISDAFRLEGSGTASLTQSTMQSVTLSFSASHTLRSFASLTNPTP
jgi:hypothetical protein